MDLFSEAALKNFIVSKGCLERSEFIFRIGDQFLPSETINQLEIKVGFELGNRGLVTG